MKKRLTRPVFLCLIGTFTFYGSVLGQENAQDRRKWILVVAVPSESPTDGTAVPRPEECFFLPIPRASARAGKCLKLAHECG